MRDGTCTLHGKSEQTTARTKASSLAPWRQKMYKVGRNAIHTSHIQSRLHVTRLAIFHWLATVHLPHCHVLGDQIDPLDVPLALSHGGQHVRVDVLQVVQNVRLAGEHHWRRLEPRPDVDHEHSRAREAERVAEDAAARAAGHLMHRVHHARHVAAARLAPHLRVPSHELRLGPAQPCEGEHLLARVDAHQPARRRRRLDGSGESLCPRERGGGEGDAAAQVDHLGVGGDERVVHHAADVDAGVGELVDGVCRDGHDHRVQQPTPPHVAEVVDPRVVPVAVRAEALVAVRPRVLPRERLRDGVVGRLAEKADVANCALCRGVELCGGRAPDGVGEKGVGRAGREEEERA
mmetsp:Transcript_37172/g.90653  ORF Transcript_37172/g.90653 Transcript_37172/m.90653 type:complete len:349 (-) Transcript_37172:53-1099(-)